MQATAAAEAKAASAAQDKEMKASVEVCVMSREAAHVMTTFVGNPPGAQLQSPGETLTGRFLQSVSTEFVDNAMMNRVDNKLGSMWPEPMPNSNLLAIAGNLGLTGPELEKVLCAFGKWDDGLHPGEYPKVNQVVASLVK